MNQMNNLLLEPMCLISLFGYGKDHFLMLEGILKFNMFLMTLLLSGHCWFIRQYK